MIITVGNIKGGVGKTTIAVNLATHQSGKGESICLIDADDQGTATLFTEIRENELDQSDYTCVAVRGAQVRSQGLSLAKRFDHTIIDCGGRDTEAFRAALTICDVLLIPLAPRSFDFWAVTQLTRLLDEVESVRDLPEIYAVVNMADATGTDNDDVKEALADYEQIKVLDEMLIRRKAWPNAASKGLGVCEYSPKDTKAINEFENLIKRIFQ